MLRFKQVVTSPSSRPARSLRFRVCVVAFCLSAVFGLAHGMSQARIWKTNGEVNASKLTPRAGLRKAITVQASKIDPTKSGISDGHEVETNYRGSVELLKALEQNQARPLSLASADFDEDGVPDLVSGYGTPTGGIVTLHRGNVDAIYPNAPEAQTRKATGEFSDAPFLIEAQVFGLAQAPDFLGAGDFDADGHWDIVTGMRGASKLEFLLGDGHGNFPRTKEIQVAGGVTALTTGEINRVDGLTDIVVGVTGDKGSKAIVFEGPEGAINASPEEFALPAEATSLALGQLDDGYEMDLTVASGSSLVIVHGRDRKLSWEVPKGFEAPSATVETQALPYVSSSILVGDYTGHHSATDLAVLATDGSVHILHRATVSNRTVGRLTNSKLNSVWREQQKVTSSESAFAGTDKRARLANAQISGGLGDDLLVVDPSGSGVHILAAGTLKSPAAAFSMAVEGSQVDVIPMRLNSDARSDLVILINGNSPPSVMTTQSGTTFTVTNTNDSGPGSPRQAILDSNSNPGADSINFNIPGATAHTIAPITILSPLTDPVTIDGTTQPGFAGKPIIEVTGGNTGIGRGIEVNANNCTVRGLVVNQFMFANVSADFVVSGIYEGNYLGTDLTGTQTLGNQSRSLRLADSTGNTIGGTAAAARNLLSGNSTGVDFEASAEDNHVLGNYMGVDPAGKTLVANSFAGVSIAPITPTHPQQLLPNYIGGTTAGSGNVISGCAFAGIYLTEGSIGNVIQGNLIGTDVTGTVKFPNRVGIVIATTSNNNLVGGTVGSARNVISGNTGNGLEMPANGNMVQGNYFGTDISGHLKLGNVSNGISVGAIAVQNVVGGSVSGARNVISANFIGISINGANMTGTDNNFIQGNYIGTDVSGTNSLGNQSSGIFMLQQVSSNLVGGSTVGARNIISGNGGAGVRIDSTGSNNAVKGNFIGVDATGSVALSNAQEGVSISGLNSIIGGLEPGAANIISGNISHGIGVGIREVVDPNIPSTLGQIGAVIQGNFIGTDFSAIRDLGNGKCGIFVDVESVANIIQGNTIAFNKTNGICIPNVGNEAGTPGVQIQLVENSIYSNIGLGIDIGDPGVTSNDPLDGDSGANDQQNFPVLTSVTAIASPGSVVSGKGKVVQALALLSGNFNSAPNQQYRIEFQYGTKCQGSQFIGELIPPNIVLPGKLGSVTVTTDANGNAPISASINFTLPAGVSTGFVNATATSLTGGGVGTRPLNTSEFSPCQQLNFLNSALPVINSISPNTQLAGSAAFTLTVNGSTFFSNAKVQWNGNPIATTFINDTQLQAVVPASLVVAAGTATVTVDTGASGGGISNGLTFTIGKSDQTITFGSLANKTFGDAPFNVNATASSGLPVTFSIASGPATINGNTVTLTGAGSVTIQANQAGNSTFNPAQPVQQSFTVAKGQASINLTNFVQIFDGNPKSVSATTTPLGLSGLVVNYNGSPTPPSAVGSYSVVASLNNPNYVAGNFLGTFRIVDLSSNDSRAVNPGTQNTATANPNGSNPGVIAVLNHVSGGVPATLGVGVYSGNPTERGLVSAGGGFVDVKVTSANAGDTVVVNYYYPNTVTGATETALQLYYFKGLSWLPVKGSGNTAPVKDTTDNLDGTVSAGKFTFTLDNTSSPKVSELSGTVFSATTAIMGDINGDNLVNINDLLLMANILAGNFTPTPVQKAAADVQQDGTGKILVGDLITLANFLAGNTKTLPVGGP